MLGRNSLLRECPEQLGLGPKARLDTGLEQWDTGAVPVMAGWLWVTFPVPSILAQGSAPPSSLHSLQPTRSR